MIYADFYAKILDWNFRLVDENSQILAVVFVSKLNFSFSFVDENCLIFVVVFVTKINLFSSTKIFVFVVVDEKNTATYCDQRFCMSLRSQKPHVQTFVHVTCGHGSVLHCMTMQHVMQFQFSEWRHVFT